MAVSNGTMQALTDTFQQNYRLQQQIKLLREEIERNKGLVVVLKDKLCSYENLLIDKDGYIREIKHDIRKAERNLKREYSNYEKLIQAYKGDERKLSGELGCMRSTMFRRTCFTSVVIFLLLLVSFY